MLWITNLPRSTHLYVFAYDVVRGSARAKVAAILENDLARVQKSVFEGRLTPPQARRLAARIERVIAPGDSLRMYAVTADGLAASLSLGGMPLAEPSGFLLF